MSILSLSSGKWGIEKWTAKVTGLLLELKTYLQKLPKYHIYELTCDLKYYILYTFYKRITTLQKIWKLKKKKKKEKETTPMIFFGYITISQSTRKHIISTECITCMKHLCLWLLFHLTGQQLPVRWPSLLPISTPTSLGIEDRWMPVAGHQTSKRKLWELC